MHSLLLYDGYLYNMRWNGQLSCFDPLTGEQIYREKIGKAESFIASPVAADGKIFITDRDGTTLVISEPEMPRLLSANKLDDSFSASLAIVGNDIFLRGEKYLYCIAEATK